MFDGLIVEKFIFSSALAIQVDVLYNERTNECYTRLNANSFRARCFVKENYDGA